MFFHNEKHYAQGPGCNKGNNCRRKHVLVSKQEFEKMKRPERQRSQSASARGRRGKGDSKGKGKGKGDKGDKVPKLCREFAEKGICTRTGCWFLHVPQKEYDRIVAEHKKQEEQETKKAAPAAGSRD